MKKILSICIVLCMTFLASAKTGIIETVAFTTIAVNQEMSIADDQYFNNPDFYVKSRKHRAILSLKDNTCQLPAFTISVVIDIRMLNGAGAVIGTPSNKTLTINYDGEQIYLPKNVLEISVPSVPECKTFKVKIVSIVNPSAINISNFDLKIETEVERYGIIPAPASAGIAGGTEVFNGTTGELLVSWTTAPWAESYDLEWLYINDYSSTNGSYLTDLTLIKIDPREFQFNSTRINTTKSFYNIPVLYDHGYILYRIRGVGRSNDNSDNYETDIPQKWTDDGTAYTNVNGFPSAYRYQIEAPHNTNLNWQASSSFAEEGKSKTVVNYFDGSLRNRQDVTKISTPYNGSDKAIVVGETVYDYEGRPAVKILPVPVASPKIDFRPAFNLSEATPTKVYSGTDFDFSTLSCGLGTLAIKENSGASAYYSLNNAFLSSARKYKFIPDAQKYPFVQTKYTRDNTGRISAQSAPGADFKIGSGHETKYVYGRPDQLELDRLFGSDAGSALHYQKNLVRDANGQLSISYLDMQGKVVATSLIGEKPTAVEKLSTYRVAPVPMNIDLLNKVYETDNTGINNIVDTAARTKRLEYDLVVGDKEIRNFYYEVRNDTFAPGCIDPSYAGTIVNPPVKPNTNLAPSSFPVRMDYAVQASPLSFAYGDINGDGYEDIVSVTATKISILKSNLSNGVVGAQSFVEVVIPGESDMRKVQLVDLDNDGKKDVIIMTNSTSSSKIVVYKNISTASEILLSKQAEVSFSAFNSVDFTTGDINFDGVPDVIVANTGASSKLSILLNNIGKVNNTSYYINFDEKPYALGYTPVSVKAADFDGDGKDDIAVGNAAGGSSIQLYRNTSTVASSTTSTPPILTTYTFTFSLTLSSATAPGLGGGTIREIWVADMNKDGKPDLIASSNGNTFVFKNNTTGSVITFPTTGVTVSGATGIFYIDVRDLNKDGSPDIAVANSTSVLLFQENAATPAVIDFLSVASITTGTALKGVAIVDADHDGKQDVIVLDGTANKVYFLRNEIPGLPACYECVLDISINLKAKEQCEVERLTGLNPATPLTQSITVGPLAAITADPEFFPLFNCPATQTIFKRGKDKDGIGTIWETNKTLEGGVIQTSDLDVGSYTLTKELKVNQQSLDIYTDNYIENNACLKSFEAFEKEELDKMDFSLCNITCEERATRLGTGYNSSSLYHSGYPGGCSPCLSLTEYNAMKAAFDEECGKYENTKCEAETMMLKGDMSPGGQYGKIFAGAELNENDQVDSPVTSGGINPEAFELSVYNVRNQLPQKLQYNNYYQSEYIKLFNDNFYSKTWSPSWRYPLNVTPSLDAGSPVEGNFSYFDEEGNIDYVIVKQEANGLYTPAVFEFCTQYVIQDGGVFKVKPQYLNNVSDFIANWKPSWAQSLAVYHPEYGYLVLCGHNEKSNEFEEDLYNVRHVANTYVLDGSGTPTSVIAEEGANTKYVGGTKDWRGYFTPSATVADKKDVAKKIIGNRTFSGGVWTSGGMGFDPYFTDPVLINNLLEGEYETMLNRMAEYATDNAGKTISIWEVAHRMVNCGTESEPLLGTCSPNPCEYSFLDSDEEWYAFRSIYLSLKQEIMKEHATRVAIRDGFYNGCIDQRAFDITQDMFLHTYYAIPAANYASFPWLNIDNKPYIYYSSLMWPVYMLPGGPSSLQSQYYNPEQPCNSARSYLYSDKRARFPKVSHIMNQEEQGQNPCMGSVNGFDDLELPYCPKQLEKIIENAKKRQENQINEKCQQCPVAAQFVGLLNEMRTRGVISAGTSASTIELLGCGVPTATRTYPGYTDDLARRITGQPSNKTLTMSYSQQMVGNVYHGKFTYTYYTNDLSPYSSIVSEDKEFTIQFPTVAGVTYNITDIVNFCCLQGGEDELAGFEFALTATVEVLPQDEEYIAQFNAIPTFGKLTKQLLLKGYSETIDLVNCLPNVVCKTDDIAYSYQNLFNGLMMKKPIRGIPSGATVTTASGNFLPVGGTTSSTGSGTNTNAIFTVLNNQSGSPVYWDGTLASDLEEYFNTGSTNPTQEIYWTAQYMDMGNCKLRTYIHNQKTDGSGNPLTYAALDNLGCKVDFEVPCSAGGPGLPSPLRYNYGQIVSITGIKGNKNKLTATVLVNTGTTGSPVYVYDTISAYSSCFTFNSCTDKVDAADESGAKPPKPSGGGKKVISNSKFPPEKTGRDTICSDNCGANLNGSCWEAYLDRINYIIEQAAYTPDFIPPETFTLTFPQFNPLAGGLGSDGCPIDCSFTLSSKKDAVYGNIDLFQIAEVIGTSRVYGSTNKLDIYVKLKGSGAMVVLEGTSTCSFPKATRPGGGGGGDGSCPTCGNVIPGEHDFGKNYGSINYTGNPPDVPYNGINTSDPGTFSELYNYGGSNTRSFDMDPAFTGEIDIRNPLHTTLETQIGALEEDEYGFLDVPLSPLEYAICGDAKSLVIKMGPTGTTYRTIWANKTTPSSLIPKVEPKSKYYLSFIVRRLNGIGTTALEFGVELYINGQAVPFTRKNRLSYPGMRYEVYWDSQNATEANIEIRLKNRGSADNVYALSGLTLSPDCKPYDCCPLVTPQLMLENPCRKSLEMIAQNNATIRYEEYIKNIRNEFQRRYVKKCLSVYEDFFMRYNNSEDHTTLYYYDQAGNLVRTIPPKGVVPFDPVIDKAKLDQVRVDRAQGVKTVFTTHTMATTYKYNSLNQLQYQSTPDQLDMKIFESKQASTGLPVGQVVNDMQFTSPAKGFAVTEDASGTVQGHIYTTNNSGNSWTEITAFGVPDLNDLKSISFNETDNNAVPDITREFAVGKNGTLLERNAGNNTWALKTSPTNGEIVRIVPIITSSKASLWLYEKDGTAWYLDLTDVTETWSTAVTTLKEKLKGALLKDISFKPSDVTDPLPAGEEKFGYAVSDNGRIYATTDEGATWQLINNGNVNLAEGYGLYATHFWDGNNGFMGGDNGLLLKGKIALNTPDEPVNWKIVPNNLTTKIKKLHFSDAQKGAALVQEQGTALFDLYYTESGGTAFGPALLSGGSGGVITDIVDFYFLDNNKGYSIKSSGIVYVTTDGGKTWQLVTGTPPNFSAAGSSATSIFAFANTAPIPDYIIAGGTNRKTFLSQTAGTSWTTVSAPASSLSVLSIHASNIGVTATTPYIPVSVLLSDNKMYHCANILAGSPTWNNAAYSDAGPTTIGAASFYDRSNGFLYSSSGHKLYKTADAGASWTQILLYGIDAPNVAFPDPEITPASITGLFFANNKKGVVISSKGEICVMDNADQTGAAARWYSQKSLISTPSLNAVKTTTTFVHVAGPDGIWMYYNPASASADPDFKRWFLLNTNLSQDINDITTDGGKIYAVGSNGLMIRPSITNYTLANYSFPSYTVNNSPSANISTAENLNRIMVSGTAMYICGENKTILSGVLNLAGIFTGTLVSNTVNTGNVSLKAIGKNETPSFYAVGEKGTLLLKGAGSSTTWDITGKLTSPALKAIHMVTSSVGYAAGTGSKIWKTTNGGESWLPQNGAPAIPPGVNFNGIHFSNTSKGFAVGNAGNIYYTNNGGATWTSKSSGANNLNKVQWINATSAIVVGDARTVLKTTNAGDNWITVSNIIAEVPTVVNFNAFYSPDETVGYIAGNSGTLVRINNLNTAPVADKLPNATGGIYVTPTENLNDIYFTDRLIGYAVGQNKALYKTADGGNQWAKLTVDGTANDFKTIAVRDENNFTLGGNVSGSPYTSYVTHVFDFTDQFSTRFYYDKMGRLVASQNSKQYNATPLHNRYSYTTYDFKGRITEVGEIDAATPVETSYGFSEKDKTIMDFRSGRWEESKWIKDAGFTAVVTNGNFVVTGTTVYGGVHYELTTIPGKVYRVKFKALSSRMDYIALNIWNAPWVPVTSPIGTREWMRSQNGLDREMTFMATKGVTTLTIQKGFQSTPSSQDVVLEYLMVEELSSPYVTYACTELQLFKTYLAYRGWTPANLADPVFWQNMFTGRYFPLPAGADILKAVNDCESGLIVRALSSASKEQYNAKGTMNEELYAQWLEDNRANKHDITRTFYDVEPPLDLVYEPFDQKNLRNRVASTTVSSVYNNDLSKYDHANHYSYDIHGNVSDLVVENNKMKSIGITVAEDITQSKDYTYKHIRYEYDLISGKVNKVSYQKDYIDQFYHRYEYDADNRITDVETSYDGINWESDARYDYYLHGPLARTEIGHDNIQGMDYAYTTQGWLKAVNSATLLSTDVDMGQDGKQGGGAVNGNFAIDEVGYGLGYFHNDYKAIDMATGVGNPIAATNNSDLLPADYSKDLYNGNISHMVTAVRQFMRTGVNAPLASAYSYDQLNRIKEAKYYNNLDQTNNVWLSNNAPLSDYYNKFEYDANGNILKQKRNGSAGQGLSMDDLTYEYYSNSNRLKRVTDVCLNSAYTDDINTQPALENYTYDESGNLISDLAEEIANIEWTVYGKIRKITRTSGSLKPDLYFEYGSDGNRVLKIVTPKTPGRYITYTYYVRDAQGNVMATYDREYKKSIDYDSLTYANVNDSLINAIGTASQFSSFISGLHSTNTEMVNYVYTQLNTTLSETNKKNFLYQIFPEGLLENHSEIFNPTLAMFPADKFVQMTLEEVEKAGDVAKYFEDVCGCIVPQSPAEDHSFLKFILRNKQSRESFFRGLYGYNSSLFADVLTNLGIYTGDLETDIYALTNYGTHHGVLYNQDLWTMFNSVHTYIHTCYDLSLVLEYMHVNNRAELEALLAAIPHMQQKNQMTGLCNCSASTYSIEMLEWWASTDENRRAILISGLFGTHSNINSVMTDFGYPTTDVDVALDYMMGHYTGTDHDIAEILINNYYYGDCNEQLSQLFRVIYALFPEEYNTIMETFPNREDIIRSNECSFPASFECLPTPNFTTVTALYEYYPAELWDAMFEVRTPSEYLDMLRTEYPSDFLRVAALLYPAHISSYQQAITTLYTNGMEGYFAYIKNNYLPAQYKRLVDNYTTASHTYMDSLKLGDWSLYGSSRLGILEAGKSLFGAKFNATASVSGFTGMIQRKVYFNIQPQPALGVPSFYSVSRGQKRYELSNHLGNVLTVVSDKKKYLCDNTILKSTFSNTNLDGWLGLGNTTQANSASRLFLTCTVCSIPQFTGATRVITVIPGKTYKVDFDFTTLNSVPMISHVMNIPLTTTYGQVNFTPSGHYTYNFTAPVGVTSVRLYVGPTSMSSQPNFLIDNVKVVENGSAHYEADVLNATDYSPFGAPLPDRSWSPGLLLNDQFTATTDGWDPLSGGATHANDNGRLKITATGTCITQKEIAVQVGTEYELTFEADAGNFSNIKVGIYGGESMGYPQNTLYTTTRNGLHVVYFTATSPQMFIRIMPQASGSTSQSCYINFIRLKKRIGTLIISDQGLPPTITANTVRTASSPQLHAAAESVSLDAGFETLAGEEFEARVDQPVMISDGTGGDGYRFGFNGMEGDNEVSGAGNSYGTEYRQYDPRLGRWMSIDPLFKNFAWQSPYAAFDNKPILMKDPKGLAGESSTGDPRTKRQERAQEKFDKKITQPLRALETQLQGQGATPQQVQTQVQQQADQLATRYQNKNWLHVVAGGGTSSDNAGSGSDKKEVIAIVAFQQAPPQNLNFAGNRPASAAMQNTQTTSLNATPGSTVTVQFNPLWAPNSLTVNAVDNTGRVAAITTTGGMISDPTNTLGVFMFAPPVIPITNTNAGVIQYSVQNTNATPAMDTWQLQIQLQTPPTLSPYPVRAQPGW
jgi:RHS repeat-associated protein